MASYIDTNAIFYDFLRASKTGDTVGTLNADITATVTSIVMAGGYTPLEKGPRVIKIDSELILVKGTGNTLTVIANGRGFFGTTAAIHTATTGIVRATFSQVLTNVQLGRMEEFENDSPGLSFSSVGAWSDVAVERMRKPRMQLLIYGGKDAQGRMRNVAPAIVQGLLQERCDDLDSGQESVTSGTIMTADYYGEEGQALYDPDAIPAWPYMLAFLNCEMKGN